MGSPGAAMTLEFLSLPFVRTAFMASLLAGTALAILGAFVLAKRVSFSGLAISQLAALGTAVGSVLNFHMGKFGLAIFFVACGMAFLLPFARRVRVPSEAWVASLYILGAALSVLILSKAAQGESHTLEVFFGNVLSIDRLEVIEAAALLAVVALMVSFWFHRWIWISFDEPSAKMSGIKTGLWNALFFAVFALAMTVSIHIFGVLLAFAYLLLPAAIAFATCSRLARIFAVIPAVTVLVTALGFYLSFHWDFPTGPFIAASLAALAAATRLVKSLF